MVMKSTQLVFAKSYGVCLTQIQQFHRMEKKTERDFKSFVQRTSNYVSLKVV